MFMLLYVYVYTHICINTMYMTKPMYLLYVYLDVKETLLHTNLHMYCAEYC